MHTPLHYRGQEEAIGPPFMRQPNTPSLLIQSERGALFPQTVLLDLSYDVAVRTKWPFLQP